MLSSKGSQGTCIPCGVSTFLPTAFTAHCQVFPGFVAVPVSVDNEISMHKDFLLQ